MQRRGINSHTCITVSGFYRSAETVVEASLTLNHNVRYQEGPWPKPYTRLNIDLNIDPNCIESLVVSALLSLRIPYCCCLTGI